MTGVRSLGWHDAVRSPLVIPIVAATSFSALVAVASAVIAIGLARPSEHELQRAALEETGLPRGLLDLPAVQPLADNLTSRVAHRIIDESQPSLALGAAVGTLAGAASALASTVVLIRSRHHTQDLE
jgi:hypothetical protein